MTDRHSAYTALLMRHRDMLWRLCWNRVGGDRDRCQDILQEVSIALWENFDKLRPDVTPRQERAWVCWQARSVFYRAERRQMLATVPITDALADSLADEDTLHRKELIDDLLSALSPDERRMVRLYLQGYHGDEIGAELGVGRDTVYQRMRRVTQKLRRLALILLALLLTSAIAVAVVPQWRQFFFGGGEKEDSVADSVQATPMPVDTVPPANAVRRAPGPRPEPVEKLPPLDVLGLMTSSDGRPPIPDHDGLTISVDGTRLIITGASGEEIRIYDHSGSLVAAQTAGGFCIIDLFPSTEAIPGSWRYRYILHIGNRPALQLQL